ncbi:glycosyltransferase family 2 protein [Chryseobacterium sp. G0201]|uniref:glycosyltransferase family 2 protein n=1 Tax=Chryseobacterium sp. G0201 TaxID=2487065 RepID=UPI000F4E3D48|nr:glycosyltransferase family 2 protein [Chryseobacterium sp. G0201]AZA53956.1 glycosyltransferase family 2 protein [Chryseobacterium sp. G0201]
MNLTVASIVYNESENLDRFLSSIYQLANEIIIVDSFSTDQTKKICLQYPNVRFFEKKFDGYGSQKNHAIGLCSAEWILFLDADEVPDDKCKEEIMNIVTNGSVSQYDVYNIKLDNIFLGCSVRYGGWGDVYRERLFRKGAGKYSNDIVHEKFITKSEVGKLSGIINHYTYRNINHHIEKINRYSQMMAEKMVLDGKKPSIFKIIVSPLYTFIKTYFLKLGFLDGIIGYYCSKTLAYYTFLKYLKVYEKFKN